VLNLEKGTIAEISNIYINKYKDVYPNIWDNREKIIDELNKEEEKFITNLQQGLKEFEKVISHIPTKTINGKTAFRLFDTFGFPLEMTVELANENGFEVDVQGYDKAFAEHQQKSKAGAEQKFKGGLADNGEATTLLHTATHLMHAALAIVLKQPVKQMGSNITAERLRFDFNLDRPMTGEEIAEVERLVNEQIKKEVQIVCEEMTVPEAKAQGAIGVFDSKYGDMVKVYTIGDFSKEICGGPHAANTKDLISFKIVKEQSSSSGVRRIKAVIGVQ
jgi:alanyl-tRNA synthetase